MQKLINNKINKMSKLSQNLNNVDEVQENSYNYKWGSIITKIDFLTERFTESDKRHTDQLANLKQEVQDLNQKQNIRLELINTKLENTEVNINKKIEDSDTNTNSKFTTMQNEITNLKNQDGQKALKIIATITAILVSVFTLVLGAFVLKFIKLN